MKRILLSLACAILLTFTSSAGTVDIRYLGTNNTLIKVHAGGSRFLMLPIEEDAPEAEVKILVGGKLEQRLDVRLAQRRIDYYVPLDLAPYKDCLLDITTETGRSRMRNAKDDVCWKNITLSDHFDTANTEKFRPAYHHTPLYGWMNDPNGMVYKDGVWHLYYQYNPYGSMWGNMHWAHSTSKDLIHWEAQPVALAPDALGAIFSGSAVVDSGNDSGFGAGSIVAAYTSAGDTQKQSLAYSNDGGITFKKYEGNPIITSEKECRDDKLVRYGDEWVLVLADALEHQDWFYTSTDLRNWTKTGSFGAGYGAQGGVWECPDLMELPVRGTNEKKWVLLVNLNPGGPYGGSATQYFTGEFDGTTFRCDNGPEVTKWMDWGKDNYATVSWFGAPEGRHTVIGWMSNWQYATAVPTLQFRSANTLPRELSLRKTADGDYFLCSEPVPEALALRGEKTAYGSFADAKKRLPRGAGGLYEILLTLDGKSSVDIGNGSGEKVTLSFDPKRQVLTFDRRESGDVDFSNDFAAVTAAPTGEGDSVSLRIFMDRCSMEIFAQDGSFVMTNLFFPSTPYDRLEVSGKVANMDVYKINP